jgi:hypothetical protein
VKFFVETSVNAAISSPKIVPVFRQLFSDLSLIMLPVHIFPEAFHNTEIDLASWYSKIQYTT